MISVIILKRVLVYRGVSAVSGATQAIWAIRRFITKLHGLVDGALKNLCLEYGQPPLVSQQDQGVALAAARRCDPREVPLEDIRQRLGAIGHIVPVKE